MCRKIYITNSDKNKLLKIISNYEYEDLKSRQSIKDIEVEINRADVTSPEQVPSNVITMNTKVRLLIGDTEEEITLVYPSEADILNNKISVLSPVGTAILGYCEGSIIEWKVPNGIVQIEVKKILFQPEAEKLYEL